MEPHDSRLVVEIPTTVYEELDLLQKWQGRFKKSIVSDLVHKEYLRQRKANEKRAGVTINEADRPD